MCAKLTHAVLLLQMLAHSIFGCCWHHAHDPGSTCQHHAVANAETKRHTCSHHSHDRDVTDSSDSPNESEPLPHRSPPCDEERCQFVKAETTPLSDVELCWLFGDDCPCVTSLPVRIPDLGTTSRLDLDRPGRLLTPVERCALLQAWLI